MADVEMADGAPADTKTKVPVKASKSGTAEGGDTKKRFEVKKVGLAIRLRSNSYADTLTVERRGSLGLGHRRRQLCHLPKSYHGSL